MFLPPSSVLGAEKLAERIASYGADVDLPGASSRSGFIQLGKFPSSMRSAASKLAAFFTGRSPAFNDSNPEGIPGAGACGPWAPVCGPYRLSRLLESRAPHL